ncbi:peptidoglycan-binding domain-containing protein [uncultured Aliiroseovarius sp.]|uniref:peptidoglycan-binding domain-containing protein n=1 Tax=uncultured Aliiroseovarius sp. TaxID=1658783 RepID=UPI00262827FD|nr:peptidoglycan-binding domain-containing protein [uncultured Aliiroseovarius sp.]
MKFHWMAAATLAGSLVVSTNANANESVRRAQNSLNGLGYDVGVADGVWGKNTERGLLAFLEANSTEWDGKLDENELELLYTAIQKTGQSGIVSTAILENNFCEAKEKGNGPYRFFINRNIREADSGGVLPVGKRYLLSESFL